MDDAAVTSSAALAREHARLRDRLRDTNETFTYVLLAMQAAWIEWKYGDGAEAAMLWIENTLDGPDQLPRVEETGTDAQAFFDRERERLQVPRERYDEGGA